jgi:hypothetical protein
LLLLKVLISAPGCSLSARGKASLGERYIQVLLLLLQEKQQRSELPRRIPCEKITQVAGTLNPQESRTLHFNQLVNDGNLQK